MTLTPPHATATTATGTVRLGDRSLTPEQLIDLLIREPTTVANTVHHGGFQIEVTSSVAATIRDTALSDLVTFRPSTDTTATVAVADFGLVEVGILLAAVGTLAAIKVGYDQGKKDALQECSDQNDQSDDDSHDNDNGDDGGDGEGP